MATLKTPRIRQTRPIQGSARLYSLTGVESVAKFQMDYI